MKNLFHYVSILFILFIILLLLASASVKAQSLSNELSFSVGTALPISDDMHAIPGFSFQLDYKIMNKNFGMQLALNRMNNHLDSDLLLKKHNASSMNDDKWASFSMMMKLVGRVNFLENKLLIDFNVGAGAMITYFPKQRYEYSGNVENQVDQIGVAAVNNNPTAFVFGIGGRANYNIHKDIGLFISYDFITGNQTYETVSTVLNPINVSYESVTYRISYSLINVGFTIFISK